MKFPFNLFKKKETPWIAPGQLLTEAVPMLENASIEELAASAYWKSEPSKEDLDFLNLSGAKGFHDQGIYGEGVTVSVIDTGIFAEHPEFSGVGKIEKYYTKSIGYGEDDNGHGTHCAGTICGQHVGHAPNIDKLLSYKILDMWGTTNSLNEFVEDMIWAIDDSVARGADIISMSLSCNGTRLEASGLKGSFQKAIQRAVAADVAVIVACGNDGDDPTERYPGFFPEPITVGAVDEWFTPAYFTSVSEEVDVCQVGVNVWSACHYTKSGVPGYVKMSGTSMATPNVAGLAALVISKYKKQNGGKRMPESLLYGYLKLHGVDLHEPGFDPTTGVGFCTLKEHIKTIYYPYNSNTMVVNGETRDIPIGIKLVPTDDGSEHKSMLPVREDNEEQGNSVTWKPDGVTIRC